MTTPRLHDGSHPNRSFDSLYGGGRVVVPQDGGHGDRSGQVLDYVPIDGEDDLLLSEVSSFLSLPPQSFLSVPSDSESVVAPLDGGQGHCPGLVPDSAAGGGEDDPIQLTLHWSQSSPWHCYWRRQGLSRVLPQPLHIS